MWCGYLERFKPRPETGRGNSIWSVGGPAGPDQGLALAILGVDQRGVDRRREARIVEFDGEVFAAAFLGGLLPGRTELGLMWCTT